MSHDGERWLGNGGQVKNCSWEEPMVLGDSGWEVTIMVQFSGNN